MNNFIIMNYLFDITLKVVIQIDLSWLFIKASRNVSLILQFISNIRLQEMNEVAVIFSYLEYTIRIERYFLS